MAVNSAGWTACTKCPAGIVTSDSAQGSGKTPFGVTWMRRFRRETMPGVDVKRLAAIDMYGVRGTVLRRRVVLGEFAVALPVAVALGIWLVIGASGLGARVFGIWVIGAGLNYVPLAAYAISLSRAGALEAELAGVDAARELRRYSTRRLWTLVPLSVIAMTLRHPRGPRGGTRR